MEEENNMYGGRKRESLVKRESLYESAQPGAGLASVRNKQCIQTSHASTLSVVLQLIVLRPFILRLSVLRLFVLPIFILRLINLGMYDTAYTNC